LTKPDKIRIPLPESRAVTYELHSEETALTTAENRSMEPRHEESHIASLFPKRVRLTKLRQVLPPAINCNSPEPIA
jgi:hypothetical protein